MSGSAAAPAAAPAIDGRTPLAGVIGWPVSHSCSPLIHNAWLRRLELPGAYLPLPVRPGGLRTALDGLRACGFRGVNVTAPHKEDAFAACDRLSDTARACGAVNTITFDAGGVAGDNSDGFGFLRSLRDAGVEPAALGSALLLGAGGAARAIADALRREKVRVLLCNRTPERAARLDRDLGGGFVVVPWEHRNDAAAEVDLLVNTTSLGTHSLPPEAPLDLARAAATLVVSDIVYRPAVTPLLAAAALRGLRTVGGLGMLVGQARVGFRNWFGAKPPDDRTVQDEIAATIAAAAITPG